MALEKFVASTLILIDKERECEIQEGRSLQERLPAKELQRRGICLLQLRIANRRSGLYGRTIVDLEPFYGNQDLPSHNMTPGDIVGIELGNGSDCLASGVVTRVTKSNLAIACDESNDVFSLDDNEKYKAMKLANDVTYKRIKRALKDLHRFRSGCSSQLISVLFNESLPSSPNIPPSAFVYFNDNLDNSQKEAVQFALCQREVAIIHGPPGTGKTTTVIEIIQQSVKQGLKILACAPSNIAVDNLLERLTGSKCKVVRLGHPARVLQHIQKYSLDAILSASDESKIVVDVRKDLDNTMSKIRKTHNRGEKQHLKGEMKHLRKELHDREIAATRSVLQSADIVLATLTSASRDGPLKHMNTSRDGPQRHMDTGHFDLLVIDECTQALEAACWIVLQMAPRCILAGDHHQLPPTILCKEAARDGLELTLMQRVLVEYGELVTKMLTTQYRMHHTIMAWASEQFYEGKLQADASVTDHLLCGLPGVADCEDTKLPMLLIDTTGCNLNELDLPEEISKGNEGEADVVRIYVEKLISYGLKPSDIAVITPYNLQVELLRLRLSQKYTSLEIKSVDGFQGREKEAVILSLVRSNDKGEVGFLADKRRINVAITRARRHVCVICDSETVAHDPFLASLIDYMSTNGEVQSACQYIDGFVDADRPEMLHSVLRSAANKPRVPKKKTVKMVKENKVYNTQMTEEDQSRFREIEAEISGFISDSFSTVHIFPTTLSSQERYHVHQIAEKFNLWHTSQGDGPQRQICISKTKADMPHNSNQQDSENHADSISSGISGKSIENSSPNSLTEVEISCGNETTGAQDISVISHSDSQEIDPNNSHTSSGISLVTRDIPPRGYTLDAPDMSQMDIQLVARDASQDNPPLNQIEASLIDAVSSVPEVNNTQEPITPTSINNKQVNVKVSCSDIDDGSNGAVSSIPSVICANCGKSVISRNLQLHTIHCAKMVSKESNSVEVKSKKGIKKKSAKKASHLPANCKSIEKSDITDLDALLEQFDKIDNVCNMTKCKQSTMMFGHTCPFCRTRFCMNHGMPEIHGCGDAAKVSARAALNVERSQHRNAANPLKPEKKAHLQRKLDKKLEELAGKRKSKPSKK